ncbi:MAG: DUF5666 domain-containing protein [Gammaproteobacteria bacterium]|nr:DUF5666 domain-containing protein [Gammaproteobacteria bacterium]
MRTNLFRTVALAAFVALTVSACGGGGDTVADGGTGGTGVSFGTVTDFGSVIVNGVRFDDSTASVRLDDNPGTGQHGGLKKGMVVKVSGTFNGNASTASSIEFRDNLEGPVCSLSAVGGISTLRVLGQVVIVDATTIVDNNATINVNDIVEVSGLPDDQERIRATFIEKKTQQTAVIEVKGRIDAVAAPTFTINNLVVNFQNAVIDNSIPGGQPAVGQFVEVKGTVFGCGATTDTLTATSVELESEGAGGIPAGDRAEIEGFVTAALNPPGGPGVFSIGNRQIATTGSTRFLPEDFSVSDLQVGAKVEAEGTFANGVLTATKISFRQNVKLESRVATVGGSSPNFSFTLVGLPGITITTNSATTGVDPTINAQVRVRGIEGPNNTVLATRIDDRGNSTDVFLQGAVDAAADPSITVLGVSVNTSVITQFQDVNDGDPISRTAFFGLAQPGTLVKIKGRLVGLTPIWEEAELED